MADRADVLLARGDDPAFRAAWDAVSPVLTWNHRPSARRLWCLARLGWPGTIVEIGSYLGNSTIYLALGGAEVHAVDPHTPASLTQVAEVEPSDVASALRLTGDASSEAFLHNLVTFGVRERVVYHRAPSIQVAQAWSRQRVRLLYIDGMHTYDAVREDFLAWRPFLAQEHVVLFDDYLWAEVQHAVDDLRAETASYFFYVRGGQAMFSTARLPTRIAGLP